MIDVRVQSGDFEPGRQLRRLEELGNAAVASFTALATAAAEVAEILIETYPALAKNELAHIADEACRKWTLSGLILIHRHGLLSPGSRLAFAAAAAPDPNDALAACTFLVDALRTRAPFWRKHLSTDGEGEWIGAGP